MFDLKGRVAIVTGGNGGIGLGMAKGLAVAGATVVIAGRNQEKSAAAVEQIAALKRGEARPFAVDVTDEASVRALVTKTVEACGRLDILVNNAGINIRKPPDQLTLAEWRQVLETNLTSAYLCSHAAYPAMKQAGGGKIINIGSMMSIFGAPYATPYSASKGAVVQLTRSLASAWARDNIQVNAVQPGWIDTDLTRRARAEVAGLQERVAARTPAGRWGVPGDLAGVAVFLASSASDSAAGRWRLLDPGLMPRRHADADRAPAAADPVSAACA
jgi:2-deoxy-D-gluconate 3-dehydrogenase